VSTFVIFDRGRLNELWAWDFLSSKNGRFD
jgi:hypothetical protein